MSVHALRWWKECVFPKATMTRPSQTIFSHVKTCIVGLIHVIIQIFSLVNEFGPVQTTFGCSGRWTRKQFSLPHSDNFNLNSKHLNREMMFSVVWITPEGCHVKPTRGKPCWDMTSTISCPTGGSSKCCQEAQLEQSSVQLHQEHVDYRRVESQWEELTVSGSSGFTSLRTSPGLITPTSSLKQQLSFLCRCKRLNMEKGDISTSIRCITGGLVRTAQNISRADLPSMEELWTAGTSPDGSKHMTLRLFQLLPSGPSMGPWPPHSGTVLFNTRKVHLCDLSTFIYIYLLIQLSGRFYRVSWVMMVATMS